MSLKPLLAFPSATVFTVLILASLSIYALAAPLSESEAVTVGNSSQGSAVGSEATAAPAAAAPAAAASSGGGGGGGGTTTPATTPATTPTTAPTTTPTTTPTPVPTEVPVTATNVAVTETTAKQEVINAVSPQDLGIAEVTPDKVTIVKTGTAETTITATPATIDVVSAAATDDSTKQLLNDIKQQISGQQSQPVTVQSKLEVFQVTSSDTGKSAFVSKVTLTFTAPDTLQNVVIVQVIPKSVAQTIADVIFGGQTPAVLQSDPVVQWTFDSVAKGETKDFSYSVKKKLDALPTTTVAVAKAPEIQPTPPVPAYDYTMIGIIVVVIVVIGVAVAVMRRRKV